MDEIRAGDLVMIVRWPHEHVPSWGAPGIVTEVIDLQPKTACPSCGRMWPGAAYLALGCAVPVAWLRKVPRTAPRPRPVNTAVEATRSDFVWHGS
jgi:hypothetical protein